MACLLLLKSSSRSQKHDVLVSNIPTRPAYTYTCPLFETIICFPREHNAHRPGFFRPYEPLAHKNKNRRMYIVCVGCTAQFSRIPRFMFRPRASLHTYPTPMYPRYTQAVYSSTTAPHQHRSMGPSTPNASHIIRMPSKGICVFVTRAWSKKKRSNKQYHGTHYCVRKRTGRLIHNVEQDTLS